MYSNIIRVTRRQDGQCARVLIELILIILTIAFSKCHQTDRQHEQRAPILSTALQARNLQAEQTVPDFDEPIGNHTVAVGRDAQLACRINSLGNFRTAWLRVEDKGILTIHNNIITRNYRVGLLNNDNGNTFVLTIKNVQPSDKGGYMCQINSVPMKYAIGYLDVLTPPVFSDNSNDSSALAGAITTTTEVPSDSQQQDAPSSATNSQAVKQASQVTVTEGSNATLLCKAHGHPAPVITWRREDGLPIQLGTSVDESEGVKQIEGSSLSFPAVNRLHSGAYLCIASNGVQPSASKRQVLDVQFSPIVLLPQTELSALVGQPEVQLECIVELNPSGTYHWVKLVASTTTNTQPVAVSANQQEADDLWLIEHDELMQSDKFDIVIKQVNGEKVHMMLNIRRPEKQDFGWYKCIARNKMGLQSSAIRLSESPNSSLASSSFRASGIPNGSSLQGDSTNNGLLQQQSTQRQKSHTRSSWFQRSASTEARSRQVGVGASIPTTQASFKFTSLATLVAIVVSLLTL